MSKAGRIINFVLSIGMAVIGILFRGNSSVVTVVTFDEVLASLKIRRELLAVDVAASPQQG